MEKQFSVSDLAQREAPILMRTESLVEKLRLCILYSSTQQAASLEIRGHPSKGQGGDLVTRNWHSTSDLGTELYRIADQGYEAFTAANQFLNRIRSTAGSIARPGGPLETLQRDFGNPDATENNERQLKRIGTSVKKCFESGEGLPQKFEHWRRTVTNLREEVHAYRRVAAINNTEASKAVAAREEELQIKLEDLNLSKEAEEDARTKHLAAIQNQQSVNLNTFYVPRGHSAGEYLQSTVSTVQILWAWGSSKLAASTVREAERTFDMKKRKADEFLRKIAEAEANLRLDKRKEQDWAEAGTVLRATLNALALLAGETYAMVNEFAEIRTAMEDMVDRYEEGLRDIAENSDNANAINARQFCDDAMEMRRRAMKVEYLAWMYADTIRVVMMRPMENIKPDGALLLEGPSQTRPAQGAQGGERGLLTLGNESSTSLVSQKIDQSYNSNVQNLNKFDVGGNWAIAEANRKAEQEARQEKARDRGRKFFSRRAKNP